MTSWLRMSCFTDAVDELSDLIGQNKSSHPERDSRYWVTIYHLLLRLLLLLLLS